MKLLLDTHAFLWFVAGDSRLSANARSAIEDSGNLKLISMASLWEMAIKVSLGKLSVARPFQQFIASQLEGNGFDPLPIQLDHVINLSSLPFHHRDPFDRMLVVQCMTDDLQLLSCDVAFDAYPVVRIW